METKNFAFKLNDLTEKGQITGYGSVFGNVDSYNDIVEKGAFDRFLSEKTELPILWQHDYRNPIGVWTSFQEDEHGLLLNGKLLVDEVQQAKEAYALVKNKAIKGLSIGYMVTDCCFEVKNDICVRRIKEAELFEVSLVTFPANEEAQIQSLKTDCFGIRNAERCLIAGGFSKKQTKGILSAGYNAAMKNCDDFSVERDVQKQDEQLLNSINSFFNNLRKI